MKRLLLLAFLLPIAAQAQTPSLPPGPKIAITTITQAVPVSPQYFRVEVPYYKEKMPKWSSGRIEIKSSTAAEMNVNPADVLRLVRQGQVDIGGAPLATVSGDVPFLEVADLAGLNPTLEQARRVMRAVSASANQELERFGIRIIGSYVFPGNVLFCRQPMKSFADLKGRKVRTFGPSLGDLVVEVGGQPVSIAFGEVYSALERGTVDCAVTGTQSANATKWYEVTTHMYLLPLAWATSAYYANVKWWNSLSPEVRDFIARSFEMIEEEQWQLARDSYQEGIDCNAGRKEGCKTSTLVTKNPLVAVEPTEQDKAALKSILAKTVIPNWVKRCGARCGEQFNTVVAPLAGVRYEPR
ncbi:MAG TPA: TRAP transporter substrate-binding protein [Burkholderiales bacterium]